MIRMRAMARPQDVALRLEPGTRPACGVPDSETVPPAPMAAVLLVNAARWQLRDGSRSMAIVLRGLSLLVTQAEGEFAAASLPADLLRHPHIARRIPMRRQNAAMS